MTDFEPGLYDDVTEADYHSGKFGPKEGSLSVSGAKLMLKAPAKYRWERDNPVHKNVFDFGTAAHALVLGIGAETVVVDADSWRTKAAKEAQEAARAADKTPLLAADWERVLAMADALTSHRLATRLLSEGQPEVSAFCMDEETGIVRRSRFDWLGTKVVTDYKTAASSEPAAFLRAAVNFGYHMQAAWYQDIAADLGHPAQAFAFIAQEKTAPYIVTVIELPADLVDVGRARNRVALQRFRDCIETDLWPGYVPDDTFATPTAPRWALNEEIPA